MAPMSQGSDGTMTPPPGLSRRSDDSALRPKTPRATPAELVSPEPIHGLRQDKLGGGPGAGLPGVVQNHASAGTSPAVGEKRCSMIRFQVVMFHNQDRAPMQ